jgi:formylglycine-generating enzyme required for sulfatase activity
MYFWFDGYKDHPVVGISYYQAKAFLHWKTKTEQKKLDAKKSKYKIEYTLPCEIEWEIAATSEKKENLVFSYGDFYPRVSDQSWLTDLMLDTSFQEKQSGRTLVDSIVYEKPEWQGILLAGPINEYLHTSDSDFVRDGKNFYLHKTWYEWDAHRMNFLVDYNFWRGADPDHYLFTSPADLTKVKRIVKHKSRTAKHKRRTTDNSLLLTQIDNNGISHMGGNVSEWLEEDYSSWSPAIHTRLKMLRSVNAPDAQMQFMHEHYFNSLMPKNGKLVRGANWYDQRYGNFGDKNPAGANAKTFVDPAKSHCTLGFRYVVHVTEK